MQISLNQLVELLAAEAKQAFDIPTQEMLKVIVNYKIADWYQKVIEAHPEQRRFYLKYISDELVEVDKASCPAPSTGCTVMRTSKQIPIPLRTSYALFDYVGDTDKTDGYTYTPPDQLLWIVNYGSKFTKDRPKWFYEDKYIYIYNEDSLDNITIGGIWPDRRQLNTFKCDDQPCFTDDMQLDIPNDIINVMIQDIIKNELRLLMDNKETEVTLDKEDGTN